MRCTGRNSSFSNTKNLEFLTKFWRIEGSTVNIGITFNKSTYIRTTRIIDIQPSSSRSISISSCISTLQIPPSNNIIECQLNRDITQISNFQRTTNTFDISTTSCNTSIIQNIKWTRKRLLISPRIVRHSLGIMEPTIGKHTTSHITIHARRVQQLQQTRIRAPLLKTLKARIGIITNRGTDQSGTNPTARLSHRTTRRLASSLAPFRTRRRRRRKQRFPSFFKNMSATTRSKFNKSITVSLLHRGRGSPHCHYRGTSVRNLIICTLGPQDPINRIVYNPCKTLSLTPDLRCKNYVYHKCN
ncbi:MAG: hypothetical protein [Cressdnaviricota sp.]|nr:MAG: hypothetical protein [Cressdnaviricota sp.]